MIMMSEERLQKFHTDDTTLIWEAASYWLKQICSLSEALPRSVLQHLHGISALVPLTSQGNNFTGQGRKMLAVFTLANLFLFYFQSTNAAGYTAVYITVNVSYINLMFFMCLRCSVTSHILLLLSLLFPLSSCHSPT